ncbi:hypothetical protein [Stakelama pacifica]|uniref:Uncharacterized protein n=1 Tax=Stakelama pacifica TaxID=517720 RepID=A0A4R6FQA4_9SPHN|nr:hypothetical protein [Stakelama pacifica]TDN82964.1 hypothetical protein EV664_105162 [Stakelama pacifica]GGO95063.1 hypothetical protein GCM10011329_18360 [Stakelama pacifica]
MSVLRKLRVRLVADWRTAWRWWSVQFGGLAALFLLLAELPENVLSIWGMLPAETRSLLPHWFDHAALVCGGVAFVLRFVKQGKDDGDE